MTESEKNHLNEKADLFLISRELKRRVNQLLLTYGSIIIGTIVLFLAVTAGVLAFFYNMLMDGDFYGRAFALGVMIIIVAGICVGAVLKPLFKIMEPRKIKGKEIYRKDYPELFELIDEVVQKAECRSPKHVYVSDECNAYVFYSSLLGYISPKYQNLTIGLPLLLSLNKSELKAILSHEFGHFTQKSVAMNRIANLSEYICACIARTQEEMEEAEPDTMKSKAQFFANIVNGILYKQYEKVAPLNGVLSRAQEFDADKYACEIAGTDACVSALSKIEEFSKRWDNYLSYVEYHMKQNKIVPESVLTLYKHFSSLYDNVETRPISPETVYEAPVTHFSSRLNYAIDTSTHPSTEARCEAVRNLPFVKTLWNMDPAPSYLKGSLDAYIHDSIIKPMMEKSPQTPFVKKELTNEYIQNDIKEIVPSYLHRFYCDRVFYTTEANQFSEEEIKVFEESCPFTEANARILEEFYVARRDYDYLNDIMQENSIQRQFLYNNVKYDGQHAPVKEHREYVDPLYEKVQNIVKHCNYWVRIKLNHDIEHRILHWSFKTDIALRGILDDMRTVHAVMEHNDTSTKAVEYVDKVDARFREIFMALTNNLGFFGVYDWVCEQMEVTAEDHDRIIQYFKEDRKSLKEMCDVFLLLGKTMNTYTSPALSEFKYRYIWSHIKEASAAK